MKTPWRRIATGMPELEVGARIGKVLISRDFGSRSPARQGREGAKDLRPYVKLTEGAPSETMQALDETTLALGRATKALGADDGRQDASLARRRGRRQVFVEESGLRARASPVRQGRDLDHPPAAWKRDAHQIPRPKGARPHDGHDTAVV